MPPLPHWTEPPTGAVPAIFADDDEPADELDAWATVTGAQPRFRAEGSDWAASDFADDLSGEHEKLGALSNEGPVDEEASFARDLAAKRRGPRARGAARTATARRPPRARTPVATRPSPTSRRSTARPHRDLPTAILTAAAVAVVAVVCFTQGRNWTVVLAALVVGIREPRARELAAEARACARQRWSRSSRPRSCRWRPRTTAPPRIPCSSGWS